MFSEELSSNASRKRAEQNRARRRQLKQKQQQTKNTPSIPTATSSNVTATSVSTVASTSTTTSSLFASAPISAAQGSVVPAKPTLATIATTTTATTTSTATVPMSAVEKAQQQRQIRALAATQQKAAIRIQSFYRSFRSNQLFRAQQTTILEQRLQDLATLKTLLQSKTKTPYVPPPATTTALVQQLEYLTSRTPYFGQSRCVQLRSNASLLVSQVLEHAVLPGSTSTDENVNPLLVWFQTPQGLLRWNRLLRLLVVVAMDPGVSTADTTPVLDCLRVVLQNDSDCPPTIVQSAQSVLLLSTPVTLEPPDRATKSKVVIPPYAEPQTCLDLIAILRYYLLFSVAGPDPIPLKAKDYREECVRPANRARAGALLRLIWGAINATTDRKVQQRLQIRMVTEIWSVPLLTWKVSTEAVAPWVNPAKSADGRAPFLTLLQTFCEEHRSTLMDGKIELLLPSVDVPLTKCPCTNTQSLLANLVQLGRLCPAVNGSDVETLDFASASIYFDLVTALVNAVPLGTFSSRDSAVEWITDAKGHHKPIVLSPVIIDQCKLLLVDSFVRRLVNCSIDTDALNTDHVLSLKNEKDKKLEKELMEEGASSAASLAAKEARMDRNRSFWNSSKWARKLSKSVTGLLSNDGNRDSKPAPKKKDDGQGMLMNTSAMSRKLAGGEDDKSSTTASRNRPGDEKIAAKSTNYSPDLFYSLSRTFAVILSRWGGAGKDDIVLRKTASSRQKEEFDVATSKPEPCVMSLLNVLCFSTPVVRAAWGLIQSDAAIVAEVYAVIDADKGKEAVRSLKIRPSFNTTTSKRNRSQNVGAPLLYLFVSTLAHILIVTDDVEIHDMEKPLPLHQLRRCIQVLKALLHRSCCLDDRSSTVTPNCFGIALINASSRTMKDLYDRSSRRPICVPKLWLVPELMEKEIRRCKSHDDYTSLLLSPVLRVCPFLVSFKRRLKLFERIITTNRIEIQGENNANPFNPNPLKPGIPVRITRGRILEDGLATMNNLGPNMRQRIAVQYVNEAGVRETGIDAGGLFKEFWTDLSAVAFNPNYALFKVTDGAGNCLYPNPSSRAAHGIDHIVLFAFLGRILGKAMFEGITIHPRFAHFFLSFLRGDYNYLHMLPDLSTIDPQLYNNLMFLKNYDGDAEDLCLTFTVTVDDFGGNREIPLIPNGANVDVTNANKQRYIGLVAKYYVVDCVREQSEAFTRGLWEVIDRVWLQLFNEPELQVLISGASDGKIDVDDMRANTRYVGGFTGIDRTVNRFWNVVASLDSKQQAELLRFVTSCERPPPLGFSSMNPPFTLQRVGIMRDGDQLPTASTCFNTLKLPTYSSEKVLRQRLIYAIESGAGFELT